ncbi:MAG: tetratricopeptide repeat protein [Promethearchaeota archaeon]
MSGAKPKDLIRAEELIDQGKFDAAFQLVITFEKREGLTTHDRLLCQLLKSTLMNKLGRFDEGLELAEQAFKESQRLRMHLQRLDALIVMTATLWGLGRFSESLDLVEEGEQLIESLASGQSSDLNQDIMQRKANLINQKGDIYWAKGDLNRALECFKENLALCETLNNKQLLVISLQNIGLIYDTYGDLDRTSEYLEQSLALCETLNNTELLALVLHNTGAHYPGKGDLDRGLKLLERSLSIFKAQGNKFYIAGSLAQIAEIYRRKGDLTQALEHIERSLTLHKEIGNKFYIARSLQRIGDIYRQKNDLDRALEYVEHSMTLHKEVGNNLSVANNLFSLISIAIDKTAFEKAQQYLQQLQEINNQEKNRDIDQRYRLAEALMLKTSSRARHRVKAEELLTQVVEEEVIDHEITVIALLNLCEILLDELKAYGEAVVFQEAKAMANKIYTLAQNKHSFSVIVNALILQAKFAMVDGNFSMAINFLEQAESTAVAKGLRLLVTKVSVEKQHLEDQYDSWQTLIQDNAPFRAKLEQARLEDYIKEAKKRISMDLK